LDELDKASENPDISAALLHLVDQSQNCDFRDNFLSEISIDLSHIWYIGSMNSIPVDTALADRWWIIEVDGYTMMDKIQIIEKYLLPKALKNSNMPDSSVLFTKESISYFINKVSSEHEKGVRNIQKYISDLINKLHFVVAHQNENGQLPFSTTFNIKEKLFYPIILKKELIDILIEHKETFRSINMMYV
jgi:ATP-dependent Lon protease